MITSLEQADIALRVVKEAAAERKAKGDFTPDVEAFWDKEIRIAVGVQFVWAVRESWGEIGLGETLHRLNALADQVAVEADPDPHFFTGVSVAVLDVLRTELATNPVA